MDTYSAENCLAARFQQLRMAKSIPPTPVPSLLPENWELVFSNLAPPDFLSVINSSLEWNQLMSRSKTTFLLPLVLPLVLEFLPLHDILNCRLVNKSNFKLQIDQLFQNYSVNSKENFEYDPNRIFGSREFVRNTGSFAYKVETVRNKFVLHSADLIAKFLAHNQTESSCSECSLPANPFIASYLCTLLGLGGADEDNGESLSLLLTQFGYPIKSLHVGTTRTIPDVTIPRLLNTLANLPHLKILQLEGRIPKSELKYFRADLLPNLPNLEFLCVESFYVQDVHSDGDGSEIDPRLISPFLQRYGLQLQVFRCGGRFLGNKEIGVEVLDSLLKNVKFVKVSCLNPRSMMKLALLKSWRVETLHLMGYTRYDKRCCRLADVIRAVNNFSESLSKLEVIVQWPYQEKVDEDELVVLHKLRKLTIIVEYLDSEWFWQFLKFSCQMLEELNIRMVALAPRGYEYEVTESFSLPEYKGLFEWLPKLKRAVLWYNCKPELVIRCRNQFCNMIKCRGYCSRV